MARTPLELFYDQENQYLVTNASGWVQSSVIPEMNRNDQYCLKLQVYEESSTPTSANLSSINTTSWILTVGSVGSTPVLTEDDTSFNLDAWANVGSGQLTCYINTHSSTLTNSMSITLTKNYYALVAGTDDAIGCSQVIAQFPVKIRNVVGTGSSC